MTYTSTIADESTNATELSAGSLSPKSASFTIRYDDTDLQEWFRSLPNLLPNLSEIFREALREFITENGHGDLYVSTSPARLGHQDPVRHIGFTIYDEDGLRWLANQTNRTASLRHVARWYIARHTSIPVNSRHENGLPVTRPIKPIPVQKTASKKTPTTWTNETKPVKNRTEVRLNGMEQRLHHVSTVLDEIKEHLKLPSHKISLS